MCIINIIHIVVEDEKVAWWGAMFAAGAYWILDEENGIDLLDKHISNVPPSLLIDPLAQAALASYMYDHFLVQHTVDHG